MENYKNSGDVGEIWFDEDSQLRIIEWILKTDTIQNNNKIIDLGWFFLFTKKCSMI